MLGWIDDRPLASILPAKEAKKITDAFGYTTAGELLQHYPRAWSKHGAGVSLEDAQEGDIVTCIGEVVWAQSGYTKTGKEMHKIRISIGGTEPAKPTNDALGLGIAGTYTPSISATFFQAKMPKRQLQPGVRAMFSGKLGYFRDTPQLSHPSYMIIPRPGEKQSRGQGNLGKLAAYGSPEQLEEILSSMEYIPVYPAKKGVSSWGLLGALHVVLEQTPPIPEPLGTTPLELETFDDALRHIHNPLADGPDTAIERIKYNEALSLSLVMALRRADQATRTAPACIPNENGYRTEFLARLPFTLTEGQLRVVMDVTRDMQRPVPMSRLLQGEVGSGKTIVSLLAMLQAIDAGKQCAMLAPTEVLAVQHARGLTEMLSAAGLPTNVVVLTGSMNTASKKQALLDIMSGQADIVVGTHAIIQSAVEFFDLGLVVVDEQHRFGVEQRDMLRNKGRGGTTPHLLVMTATPIPRTIAMTAFGDLEVSTLTELPRGRQPISSVVVPGDKPGWLARALERIKEEVAEGRQAFVVCPRIDGEGGVVETFEQLSQGPFSDLSVGLLHGRMLPEDKDRVMADFAAGGLDVLVATTVIEVGIDVPNATVMYIREAESFGVSQIHQLRGRVGRGKHPSLCLIHTSMPADSPSFQRLQAIADTSDGFKLAEIDLRSRQEGDVLGTAQSGGKRRVKLLDLIEDRDLIERAHKDAADLVSKDRQLAEKLVSDVEIASQEFIEKS